MRKALIICFLTTLILTGCSDKEVSENNPPSSGQPADISEVNEPGEPSMIISEEKNDIAGSSDDILTEAGAEAAMSDRSYQNGPVSEIIPATEISADTVSAGNVQADNDVNEDITDNESDNADPEENTETSSEPGTTGIFTSSELNDDIKARITGVSYPPGCNISYDDLRYLQLSYVDFNGQTQLGEMICNKAVAPDLIQIFSELYHAGYQIDKIRLIEEYGADDDLSCADNNTSCFNYRVVAGSTNLSKHAMGVAVDLNPFYNPYVTYPNGKIRISPPGSEPYADRSSDFPHKIDENDLAYKLFTQHGFTWGGHWKTLKDYQHFQKPL